MERFRTGPALLAAAALTACAPEEARLAIPQGAAPAHVLHTLPAWAPVGGVALGSHVFLKRAQQTPSGIGHELVHVRQQAERPLWFWVSYATSSRWRLRWEAEAYAVQARAGCPIEGEHGLAAYLAGRAYLWPATPDEARREILRFR